MRETILLLGVANIDVARRIEAQSEQKSACAADKIHLTLRSDSINLARFATRIDLAIRPECDSLGVIKAVGEHAKRREWNI